MIAKTLAALALVAAADAHFTCGVCPANQYWSCSGSNGCNAKIGGNGNGFGSKSCPQIGIGSCWHRPRSCTYCCNCASQCSCRPCPKGTTAPPNAYRLAQCCRGAGAWVDRVAGDGHLSTDPGAQLSTDPTAHPSTCINGSVPAGSYSDGKNAGPCPAGMWSAPGATSAAQCTLRVPAGSYSDGKTNQACPLPCTSPTGTTSLTKCTVRSGVDKGRSCAYLPPRTKITLPCPPPCTSPTGATELAQCTVGSGTDKGRSCAYQLPKFSSKAPQSPALECPVRCPICAPGSKYMSDCRVAVGVDKGRSCAYLPPKAKVALPCLPPCTSPPGATSLAQCTVGSGTDKGRSCTYLPPRATTALPCPMHSTSPPGATELQQCLCSVGYFDNDTAVNVVACQKCGACSANEYQTTVCGAVNSVHGADTVCTRCPAHSSIVADPPTACNDTPGFSDSYGTCAMYGSSRWCANGTAGPGWMAAWGGLSEQAKAAC